MSTMDAAVLKGLIIASLADQGFKVENSRLLLPPDISKDVLRQLHAVAVASIRQQARKKLEKKERDFLNRFARGDEVAPEALRPRLVEVRRRSDDERLFRYACLHWSIPVSSGYGRRLRFLVVDEHNGKLMGLFGLGDPVFSLAPRDSWIGWDKEGRRARLRHVVDAYVLGAVPPYSFLLGGKLIALLVASEEVRAAFKRKYAGTLSLISEKPFDGHVALITTTSALGRSSLYNRLTFQNRRLYQSVGFTRGTGDFHFNNGIYQDLWVWARRHCQPTAKQGKWGKGFRNRRETVRKCLASLGLPSGYLANQVQREIFVIPLASNTREFLRGEEAQLNFYPQPVEALFRWFRERWLLPRAKRDQRFREFDPGTLTLWHGGEHHAH